MIEWYQSVDWWGEETRDEQTRVPRFLMANVPDSWAETAKDLPVTTKKELFYRTMLPLIVHANNMVRESRDRLNQMSRQVANGDSLSPEDSIWLAEIRPLLRIDESYSDESVIVRALYKLDIIPEGLALGQAAYESGYGTSRFAANGNALFGQWTYGGKGLVPEQQRSHLGDHRIAAYDWPFDSVRSYFLNLNSHPAYEEFRKLRADLRNSGQAITSMALIPGLVNYSELRQEYVDTLSGIIRVNKLDATDGASFRNEPLRFIIGVQNEAEAQTIREQIAEAEAKGELEEIVERMRLE